MPHVPTGRPAVLPLLLVAALLVACGSRDAAMNDDPPRTEPATSPAPGAIERAVESARADLAERLGVEPARVDVIERRAVTWMNGAMGCPEPGMMYTQALVPGVWIRLSVDGKEHVYHGRRDGEPFLCPADRAEPPPDPDPLA